ncbi:cytochrome c oxidase assembly protein [Herbaspirillum lusitanum]|uniref:cytochrome c oxidase assembly protein n=1 Tax=Herbaspirillum lusitanum TaxID=213312 RepID=UPI00030C73E4|nr:cytochrome c oxidase assembly protein [Herbaspirillum lusitanum]
MIFRAFILRFLAGTVLMTGAVAMAHPIARVSSTASSLALELLVDGCLAASLLLYVIGAARLWRRSTKGRSAHVRRGTFFLLGWLALAAALWSPVDTMGTTSFAMHMIQHELLMIIAAPLLVLSYPFGTWMWAWNRPARHVLGRAGNHPVVARCWRALIAPLHAWVLHFAALWLWHAPPLFDAALRNDGIHALQHASFLFSALLFWWGVLGELYRDNQRGAAILYLFTTMMHTGALGALFAMSTTVWYAPYRQQFNSLGLSTLEDQQLGGLIMWVPGGLAYVIAGLMLCAQWLRSPPALSEHAR